MEHHVPNKDGGLAQPRLAKHLSYSESEQDGETIVAWWHLTKRQANYHHSRFGQKCWTQSCGTSWYLSAHGAVLPRCSALPKICCGLAAPVVNTDRSSGSFLPGLCLRTSDTEPFRRAHETARVLKHRGLMTLTRRQRSTALTPCWGGRIILVLTWSHLMGYNYTDPSSSYQHMVTLTGGVEPE